MLNFEMQPSRPHTGLDTPSRRSNHTVRLVRIATSLIHDIAIAGSGGAAYWMNDGSIDKIPTKAIDNLLRVAHADSLGPDGRESLGLRFKLSERILCIFCPVK